MQTRTRHVALVRAPCGRYRSWMTEAPARRPDFLLAPDWIVTVDADDRVLEGHVLAVRDGRIVDLLPRADAAARHPDVTLRDLPGQALLPGLINTHTHAAMTLFRGLADDLPLMQWLQEHIWPAEARWVDETFVHDGVDLAIAEMLLGGTTCFQDMYFHGEVTAARAADIGMRAVVGMILLDFPTPYADGPDQYLDKGLALHDLYRNHPLVATAFAPHAPYTVSDEPLERVRMYADELDVPVHMHVHETQGECSAAVDADGERPLARLQRLGLLSPAFLAVHMTALTDEEIDTVAHTGTHVLHCPEANMKLASGFCPVARLIASDVNVALGTDGASSNNDLDLFGEMRTAALLAKAVAENPAAVPARTALRMATINGARALGLEAVCGSLEVGKAADMIAVDLNHVDTQPVHDVTSQLVYATGRQHVRDVWVNGQQLVADGMLKAVDSQAIVTRARAWRQRINGS